jgi:hypothetical protein
MAVTEVNGVYVVDNPADKLMDEPLVNEVVDFYRNESEKAKNHYIGHKVNTGFSVDKEIAKAILVSEAPSLVDVNVASYTILSVGTETLLLGRDADDIVQFSVMIPKDVKDAAKDQYFLDLIENIQKSRKEFRPVLIGSYVFLAVVALCSIAVVILVLYLRFKGG